MPIPLKQPTGALVLCLAGLLPATAAETRTWQQAGYDDFQKGLVTNLSLRSDGLVTLAPKIAELFDSSSAYLWALARDSKGNVYAGGGPNATLYRISPSGEKKKLAEFETVEVHAIAIDGQDRVYAATSPDGKVYRVSADGKADVFYDTKSKYIWALAFDSPGNLYVATGSPGEVHRVTPDGKGSVFYSTEETHARSLAIDPAGNLIVGTEPRGLVIRISPKGEGFVLHQLPKREVTAVIADREGHIYAAGVGKPSPAGAAPTAPVSVGPAAPAPAPAAGANPMQPVAPKPIASPVPPPATPAVAGGSEIYRIEKDGYPRQVWTHETALVYALGLDAEGRLLIGTGNTGAIYRLDSDTRHTHILSAPPTQVTSFALAPDGKIFLATGNPGKVYELGPELASSGALESDVLDASIFSSWGRLSFRGANKGGRIELFTRSGNLEQPGKTWSTWSPAMTASSGTDIPSPPARFLQWKALLTAGNGQSPQLEWVDAAYLQKNVAPAIDEIEETPSNYRFPSTSSSPITVRALSLPPLGQPKKPKSSTPTIVSTPSMQQAKGYAGARWKATDENGDDLSFTVEIRGEGETLWKPLAKDLDQPYFSFDSTAFADGEYVLRITASDSPSNPPEHALKATLESDPILIDNTPPQITDLTATRTGTGVTAKWKAADALSVIRKAEYSIDGGEWLAVLPRSRVSDAPELSYELVLDPLAPGEHTIAVKVGDDFDNQSVARAVVK